MSHNEISDEQLTAFALGELDRPERDRVEAYIADSLVAQSEIDGLRAFAAELVERLAEENRSALLPAHRSEIDRRLSRKAKLQRPALPHPAIRWRRRMIAISVAACVLVGLVGMWAVNEAREQSRKIAARQQVTSPARPSAPNVQAVAPAQHEQDEKLLQEFAQQMTPKDSYAVNRLLPRVFPPAASTNPGMGMYPGMAMPGAATGYPRMAPGMPGMMAPGSSAQPEEASPGTETYGHIADNGFRAVAEHPLSTFSIDVDTASYSNVRRFLTQNALPPKDAVRVEEMVNYFPYAYASPAAGDAAPFAAHIEVAGCPWNAQHRLVRIGLKGKEIDSQHRPASNLVFLIDVSGSMQPDNKLPLVKRGLHMLVSQLNENDRVAIVVYAGSSGLVLPSTTGDQKGTILGAIDALGAGGSTNGAGGIERAYEEAVRNFVPKGTNRVILCTDGDFNVGVTDPAALTRLIEDKAKTGVFLSVLGFGMGNLKDATMEKLADKGNGNYAYVDNLREAHKVLVEQMSGTLVIIAKDVKVQVEFNPAVASAYRLVGYENRILAKEDFNDDTKDAGEIGAGHTVTALYEVVPAGAGADAPEARPKVDELKYQKPPASPPPPATSSAELLTVKLRYKEPDGKTSSLLQFPVTDSGASYAKATQDYKFAAAVAAFGMILRDSPHKGTSTLSAVSELAQEGLGNDESGYRREFLDLVEKAKTLVRPATGPATDSVLYPKGETEGQF